MIHAGDVARLLRQQVDVCCTVRYYKSKLPSLHYAYSETMTELQRKAVTGALRAAGYDTNLVQNRYVTDRVFFRELTSVPL
jgi:hypothetical protein